MRSLSLKGKNLVCKSQASRVGRKQKNRAGCRGRMCVAELMSDEKEMLEKVACGIAVAEFKSEEE